MSDPCHLVVDVQVLMTASGVTDPPDDGSGVGLLHAMRDCPTGRLVWDSGGLIRAQYEQKLNETTFAREWLGDLLLEGKIIAVDRATLTKAQSLAIRKTGLIGEDLHRYVRTAAESPDKCLVSHDSDYDRSTCRALKKHLGVSVQSAREGTGRVLERYDDNKDSGVEQTKG